MVSRGVGQSQMRQSTRVVAREIPDFAGAVKPSVEKVMDTRNKTLILENLSRANLEVNELNNRYKLDNQSDPMSKMEDYQEELSGIYSKYGEGIAQNYQGEWYSKQQALEFQNIEAMQNWGYQQSGINSKNSVNTAMQNSFILANQDGQEFGAGRMDGSSLMRFLDAEQEIASLGSDFGEENTKTLMKNYQRDYINSFLKGTAEVNPEKAQELLESDDLKNYLLPSDYDNMESIIKKNDTQFQKAKVDNYKNRADEIFMSNPFKFKETANYIKANGEEFRTENGLNRDNYDKILKYNKTLTDTMESKDGKTNPQTGQLYTQEEIAELSRQTSEVQTTFEAMNIGQKDGKDVIKNKEYDDIGKIIGFRNNTTKVYNDGGYATKTTDGRKEYQKHMNKTGAALMDKIENLYKKEYQMNWLDRKLSGVIPGYEKLVRYTADDLNFKLQTGRGLIVGNNPMTTEEKLSGLVMEDMNGSKFERTMVFESAWNRMQDENIPYNSIDGSNKDRVEKIFREEKYRLLKDRHPNASGSVSAFLLSDNGLESFNPEGNLTVGDVIDNFGGYERERYGYDDMGNPREVDVLRDKEGNVLDVREAL